MVAGMTGGCAVLVSRAGAAERRDPTPQPPSGSGALAQFPSCVTAPKLRPPNFPPPKNLGLTCVLGPARARSRARVARVTRSGGVVTCGAVAGASGPRLDLGRMSVVGG